MAVITEITQVIAHPQTNGELCGAKMLSMTRAINIAALDDDGSIYMIGEVPDTAVIDSISLQGAAITAGTSYDVGLYDSLGNSISKEACFAAAMDLSSVAGLPLGSHGVAVRQCMSAVSLANANFKTYDHAGHVNKTIPAVGETQKKSKYRIGLRANTVGTAAATLIARVTYRMEM